MEENNKTDLSINIIITSCVIILYIFCVYIMYVIMPDIELIYIIFFTTIFFAAAVNGIRSGKREYERQVNNNELYIIGD